MITTKTELIYVVDSYISLEASEKDYNKVINMLLEVIADNEEGITEEYIIDTLQCEGISIL